MSPDEILERELKRFEGHVEKSSGTFWERIRRSRYALIVLAISTAFLQLRGLPDQFSNTTLDAAAILQKPAEPKHVLLVTIDEHEYQTHFNGISPLNPAELSQLLAAIEKGRPALIVVDIDTSHPMFRTMQVPQEIPVIWSVSGEKEGASGFEPEKPLGGAPLALNWHSALDLIPRDAHGVIRSYARQFPLKGGGHIPSLEFAASQAYNKTPKVAIPESDNERLFDFRYKFYPIQAEEIREKSLQPGWPKGKLSGAIVVLGGVFNAARDRYATPAKLMDGAEIVAQGIEAELDNTGIPRANPWFAGALQLIAGLGLVILYRVFSLRTALLTSLLLIPALSVAASEILFHRLALWAALIPILLAILITELYTKASLYLELCGKFSELSKKSEVASPPETKADSARIG